MERVCQYKIKRWTTGHKTLAEVLFCNIDPAYADTGNFNFESMAFDLLRAFGRVERASQIEEGELYIRRRNGQKEFVRKRISITKHKEMCKCTHEHGYEEHVPRRSSMATREAELVARQQKLQAELAEFQERERRTRERRASYQGRKLKFEFELEEREPVQYAPQPQQQHHYEHHHHHRRPSHHHHHHMHYERRPSYVRERPVRRPSHCDDTLLYQRVVVNRRRRSAGGYRIITRNYLDQQPEVIRYENRSPGDYC